MLPLYCLLLKLEDEMDHDRYVTEHFSYLASTLKNPLIPFFFNDSEVVGLNVPNKEYRIFIVFFLVSKKLVIFLQMARERFIECKEEHRLG